MDYLRYYVVSLMMLAGIAGFALGGYWLWAGLGTYVVLFVLALLSGPDIKPRTIHHPRLADIPLYLHLPLIIALYATFAWRVGAGLGLAAGWLMQVKLLSYRCPAIRSVLGLDVYM